MAIELAIGFASAFEAISGGTPSLDVRNNQKVIGLDDATIEGVIFRGVLSSAYQSGSNATLKVRGYAATATTGNARIRISFEAQSGQDIDSDGFASTVEANAAADATSGKYFEATFSTLSNANMDTIAAGDMFRLKVERVGNDGTNDTMTGDFQLVSWSITQ